MSGPSNRSDREPDEPGGPTVRATSWIELVVIVLGVGVGSYLLVRNVVPVVPVWAGALLYGIAAADLYIAQLVRSRLDRGEVGWGPGRIHPIAVARAVALAKASAYLGAVALGFFGGMLVFLLTEGASLTATHADRPGAWIGAGGAMLLLGAALWLERCCRTPDDPDDQPADTSPA
ncbi:DUF3180 domain-containing protein [Tsukamurella paurometabola]|uniref:DUF3180 domain-containing protein n=1 Tax=Tsukamurella paurometabola TaxID=2061 RepID=A0A3P8JX72_TSUPA|nr:DUF3180 domain-containing protein [Tsukamurella paurometabola]MBS4102510.1 DUF3180 domain-containing protein [Tsukamurella paurometabola]UEA85303.1 DUF3180 domain-containing protein [Tsukamurella paurometabola]VDR37919.1 Protein of uncharacterised function (DUF3180) [Tsukamurella paurometabola]